MSKALFLITIVLFTIVYIKGRFRQDSRFLITIFTIALTIRIICATLIFLLSWYDGSEGFFSGDESVYYKKAVNMAVARSAYSKNIFSNTPELIGTSFAINPFSLLASILIFAFGESLLLIKYLNSFVGALLPVIIFLLAKTIFDNKKIAKISAVLIAFLPSMIVWSSVGIKEPFIILMIASIFYYYIKIQKRFNFFYLVNILVSAVVLFYLQANVVVILMLIYGLWFMFTKSTKFIKKEILVLILILIGSYQFFTHQKTIRSGLYGIAMHQTLQYRAGNYRSARYELYPHKVFREYFFDFYQHLILPKNVYYSDNINTDYIKNSITGIRWLSFLISYCKGLIFVLFSPFPWSVKSVSQLIVYPQIVFWWVVTPCIIYGMIWSIRFKRSQTILIILFIASIYSVLALTEGNIGSVFRHKDWVAPFCLMFAAIGINRFIFSRGTCRSTKLELRKS